MEVLKDEDEINWLDEAYEAYVEDKPPEVITDSDIKSKHADGKKGDDIVAAFSTEEIEEVEEDPVKAKAAKTLQTFYRRRVKSEALSVDFLDLVRGKLAHDEKKLSTILEEKSVVPSFFPEGKQARLSDSLSQVRVIAVEKYIKDSLIQSQLEGILKDMFDRDFIPVNPYPVIFKALNRINCLEVEHGESKHGLADELERWSDDITTYDVKGKRLPVGFRKTQGDENYYGDECLMKIVCPEGHRLLREPLKQLLQPKKVEQSDVTMLVGRSLEGSAIFHSPSQPFPAKISLVDHCIVLGSLDVGLDLFCNHIFEDILELASSGENILLKDMTLSLEAEDASKQKYSTWNVAQMKLRKREFFIDLQNSAIHKRKCEIELLLSVQAKKGGYVTDRARGGWVLVHCVKGYVISQSLSPQDKFFCSSESPHLSLQQGVFFDREHAVLFAARKMLAGEGGGQHASKKNVEPFITRCLKRIEDGEWGGDYLQVAENFLLMNRLKSSAGMKVELKTSQVKAFTLLYSGARFLRTMQEHSVNIALAMQTVLACCEQEHLLMAAGFLSCKDGGEGGGRRGGRFEVQTESGKVEVAQVVGTVIGSLVWMSREVGRVIGQGGAGSELDTLGDVIIARIGRAVKEWNLKEGARPADLVELGWWLGNVFQLCYLSYASVLYQLDPLSHDRSKNLDVLRGLEQDLTQDLLPIAAEMQKAISSYQVPADIAKETLLLRYSVDCSLDIFLENFFRQLTDKSLHPLPIMKALQAARSFSLFFLLFKAHTLDILEVVAKFEASVLLRDDEFAARMFVYQGDGKFEMLSKYGRQLPPNPQPGLWPPPLAPPASLAFGTSVALMSWFFLLAAAGAGPASTSGGGGGSKGGGGDGFSSKRISGATANGGVHFNSNYPTSSWWATHEEVRRVVLELRNKRAFPPGSYIYSSALGVKKILVYPAPCIPVTRAGFARLDLTNYLLIQGPKRPTALQLACSHLLDYLLELHDRTEHVPFGLFYVDREDRGCGGIDLARAGHRGFSPAQIKQKDRQAMTDELSAAIVRKQEVYSCGLLCLKGGSEGRTSKDGEEVGEYVYFTITHNIIFAPSSVPERGRGYLLDEVECLWQEDIAAPFHNVFFTTNSSQIAQSLYKLDNKFEDPAGEENSRGFLAAMDAKLQDEIEQGRYMDAAHSILYKSMLHCRLLGISSLLEKRRTARDYEETIRTSGRKHLDHKFEREYPELAALADAYRLLHSLPQHLLCIQQTLVTIASALSSSSSEIRIKLNMKRIAHQLDGCRSALLGVMREDGSNLLLYGCLRAVRLRLNAIAEHVDLILKDPATFADAASSQLGPSSVRYPSFREVAGNSAETKLMEHFSALNDLLSSAVQLSSSVVWQQFSSFQLLLDKLRAEGGRSEQRN